MVEVAVSLLNVEKENSIQTIYNLETSGINYFHIDVMDGKFVKNNTIETMKEYTQYIKQVANTPIEVHLMVKEVKKYIEEYSDMGVNSIIFHIESLKSKKEVLECISMIKQNNCKVGITLKPETQIDEIYSYLPYIHQILIMSVEPGEGGQKFLPETIEKIRKLNNYIYENGYDIDIEVDGGMNDKTAKLVKEVGANIIVAGSYILNSENYKDAIKKIHFCM